MKRSSTGAGRHRAASPRVVSDIMAREIICLREEDSLDGVAEGMVRFGLRHLPIVDGRRLVGIVSRADVLRATKSSLEGGSWARARDAYLKKVTCVREVMTRGVVTVRPDTTLAEAAHLVAAGGPGCLPVVDAPGELVGLVTGRDLLGLFATLLRRGEPHESRHALGA